MTTELPEIIDTRKSRMIQVLKDEIKENDEIDIEKLFDKHLNENYSFKIVGGPFESLIPSEVLKEMSPTDYDCECANYSDVLDATEVDGEYYWDSDIEAAKEQMVDTLNEEINESKKAIEQLESETSEATDQEVDLIKEGIEDYNKNIKTMLEDIKTIETWNGN